MAAQHGARVLIKLFDLGLHLGPGNDAHRLDQAIPEAAGQTGHGLVIVHGQQRLEQRRDLAIHEMLQAARHLLGHVGAGLVVDEHLDLGLQRLGAGGQLAHGKLAPHQPALFGKVQLGIRRVIHAVGA